MVPSTFSRLKAARCLPVVLAALIFAGCGTHTPDQSTAYMQGTAQADSAFYLQQMQQSSDDTRINWQLLAIRALVKEGKTGQAVELFNQLPQELNDAQRREKTLLAVEIKLAQKDFAGAQNLLAKITPADLEQNQQARYWQAKIDASQGRPSIDLLRALIAQEPLLGAKEKQQNIDATWQALSSMTQEQANTLVINADENILQGWLDLQRVWFDNRNDPDMMKAGIADWQKRYPNNPGAHNVGNALAAIALSTTLGLDTESILTGLDKFGGADRRFQYKGKVNGVTIIDDYAHHPTEIRATLTAAQKYPHDRLVLCFQPHTYSRTKAFLNDFADVLSMADVVVLADIYAAREQNTYGISSKDILDLLLEKGVNAHYFPSFEEIEKFLSENCVNGDLLITMGAGNVVEIGEDLLKK